MILIILLVLILMNGVGYWSAGPTAGPYRFGYGGLGLVLLVLFVLLVLHIIPGTL
jgi:hypothetical protein